MLLQVFTAVVLGGTLLGGGRGGCIGSIVGAYTLMIVVNILLVLNVSAYYSSVAEGAILLLAVLAASLNRRSPIAVYLRLGALKLRCPRARARWPSAHAAGAAPPVLPEAAGHAAAPRPASWLVRHRDAAALRPAGLCRLRPRAASSRSWCYGGMLNNPGYLNSLLVLASFLAILALGQGAAILTGGLDLSVPWMIGFCGILTAGLIRGSDAVGDCGRCPLGLALGAALGAVNGVGIVLLGLPPIVMTLAMNGILQGAALVYSNGTPAGFASPAHALVHDRHLLGVTPVVLVPGRCSSPLALLLLGRTAFGRRIYAVGNSAAGGTAQCASASAAR